MFVAKRLGQKYQINFVIKTTDNKHETIQSLFWFSPCILAYKKPAICFQFGIAAFWLYGLDLKDHPPIRCISRRPDFKTVCLRREVLVTAIFGLTQAFGIRAPRELANMYVTHL